jgi:hypothetical protein
MPGDDDWERAVAAASAALTESSDASPSLFHRIRQRWKRSFDIPLLVVSAVLLVGLLIVGSRLSWGTLKSEEGRFAVRLPPGVTARKVKQARKTVLNDGAFTFEGIAFVDGTRVGVAYFDVPSAAPTADILDNLVRFLERHHHADAEKVYESEIWYGEYPGREVVYEQESESWWATAYSRWVLVERRVYELTWIPARGEPPNDALHEFWNSFQLLGETGSVASVLHPWSTGVETQTEEGTDSPPVDEEQ